MVGDTKEECYAGGKHGYTDTQREKYRKRERERQRERHVNIHYVTRYNSITHVFLLTSLMQKKIELPIEFPHKTTNLFARAAQEHDTF